MHHFVRTIHCEVIKSLASQATRSVALAVATRAGGALGPVEFHNEANKAPLVQPPDDVARSSEPCRVGDGRVRLASLGQRPRMGQESAR